MSNKDYYQILGIPRSASSSEIKKAYLKLAKKYHPDCNSGDFESEKKFKEAGAAYDVLKDAQKKSAYDRFGHAAFEQGGGRSSAGFGGGASTRGGSGNPDVNDIFGDFFSDFMGGRDTRNTGRAKSSQVRGGDLKYNLSITLKEAFLGVDKTLNFSSEAQCIPCSGKGSKESHGIITCSQCGGAGVIRIQQGFFAVEQTCSQCSGAGQVIKNPCTICHGSGRSIKQKNLIVNVPAGIEHNTRIRIAGEGEAGIRGGAAGDLYVFINVEEHDIYQVEGANLHCKLPLSFTKAALGGEVEILTIDGIKVKLKIPSGTETGDKLRLREKRHV